MKTWRGFWRSWADMTSWSTSGSRDPIPSGSFICWPAWFPTRIGLPILSVILELPLSVRGVGRRTQPSSKLLNDLLITSALNRTVLWSFFLITKICYCWHILGTVWLLLYYWTSKLINALLSPSFPNSHHLRANFHIISYTRTPVVCAGRRTTDATKQQTAKWLAYYKCPKSDLFSTKCFKSDMLITSQWYFYSFVSGVRSLLIFTIWLSLWFGQLCPRGHGTRCQGIKFNEKWTQIPMAIWQCGIPRVFK
jgi:hypothetical protein